MKNKGIKKNNTKVIETEEPRVNIRAIRNKELKKPGGGLQKKH